MIDLKKLSNQEKEIIEEFRKRMAEVCPREMEEDKSILYRFLKARDFDLDRAEKMLRKHLVWRKANQIDTILQEFKPKEFYHKYIEPTLLGFDKEGDGIVYINFGKMDSGESFSCVQMNDGVRHWIWKNEKLRKMSKQHVGKDNELIPQCHLIIDLDELTFSNTTNKIGLEFIIRMVHVLQDNYPEFLRQLTIFNAPEYFVIGWSAIKVLMSNAMLRKVQIYGQNGWQDKLLESCDRNVLPAFLGGTRTDPDGNPQCLTFVVQGGKIPPKYFLTKEDRDFKDKSRVREITVAPSSVKEVYVDVREEGSIIYWEFFVKRKDIGFGLFYKEKDELKEILPIQRINTVDGVDYGHYRAKLVRKYAFVFDNSDSWLTTKEIKYCITVKKTS